VVRSIRPFHLIIGRSRGRQPGHRARGCGPAVPWSRWFGSGSLQRRSSRAAAACTS